jgi:hypothetical protein
MRCKLVCLLALLAAVPAAAQQPRETIALTVRPAAVPSPSLKYQLFPPLEERTPGNAALLYYRAFSPEWLSWRRDNKIMQRASDALQEPLTKMKKEELRWVLNDRSLKQLDEAASRTYCDWEQMPRFRKEGIGMLLPEVQVMREFGTLLAVRARLEMAGGDFDKAVATLQTGLKLGRDVGTGPTVIQGLVGIAICQIMLNQVDEMMQLPGAPNLYWALTTLPQPFVDLRPGLAGERIWLHGTLPGLADIDRQTLSREQQRQMVKMIQGLLHNNDFFPGRGIAWPEQLQGVALVAALYPAAKRALIAEGRKPADVEALPVVQVVMMHTMHEYRRLQDDLYRWYGLPYWIARPGMERTEAELRASRTQLEAVPLAAAVLPALGKVMQVQARVERHIAALRCLEAIRLYAAAHDGKLPAKLADISEVPIPEDPFNGKPFEYRVEGDKAILSGPPPPGDRPIPTHNTVRYELTLKK